MTAPWFCLAASGVLVYFLLSWCQSSLHPSDCLEIWFFQRNPVLSSPGRVLCCHMDRVVSFCELCVVLCQCRSRHAQRSTLHRRLNFFLGGGHWKGRFLTLQPLRDSPPGPQADDFTHQIPNSLQVHPHCFSVFFFCLLVPLSRSWLHSLPDQSPYRAAWPLGPGGHILMLRSLWTFCGSQQVGQAVCLVLWFWAESNSFLAVRQHEDLLSSEA